MNNSHNNHDSSRNRTSPKKKKLSKKSKSSSNIKEKKNKQRDNKHSKNSSSITSPIQRRSKTSLSFNNESSIDSFSKRSSPVPIRELPEWNSRILATENLLPSYDSLNDKHCLFTKTNKFKEIKDVQSDKYREKVSPVCTQQDKYPYILFIPLNRLQCDVWCVLT